MFRAFFVNFTDIPLIYYTCLTDKKMYCVLSDRKSLDIDETVFVEFF